MLAPGIDAAIARYRDATVPVLAASVSALDELRGDEESVLPREVAAIVLADPLLATVVLRHLQAHRPARRIADITTIEHAVMMMGVSPFLRRFAGLAVVEAALAGNSRALEGLLAAIARARHAAALAHDWALLRHDLEAEEVRVAALLHDLAEMLLWIFEPERATTLDEEALGYRLDELQLALAEAWGLPQLLCHLMDDRGAEEPRVRTVSLAVSVARHAANGWRDPAVRDDIAQAAQLIGIGLPALCDRVIGVSVAAQAAPVSADMLLEPSEPDA